MNKLRAGETVWIECRLAAGMFSHERTYLVEAPGGGEYQGAVQVHFCRDGDGNPIPDEHPAGQITGSVEAIVVQTKPNGRLLVAIPGDQNLEVAPELITDAGGVRRVPVRP